VQIANFRNLHALDVTLSDSVVILGENRVGKSNFIFALRIVLDASLADSARQLKLTDVWDGCDLATAPEVSIHLDFCDFADDADLTAVLTDYRLAGDPTVARISYAFRKKAEFKGDAPTDADYEFVVYGGNDENRRVGSELRRRICVDVLEALRDAEGDLGNWRRSPLRPLLEDAVSIVPKSDLDAVAEDVGAATKRLCALKPVNMLETNLRDRLSELAGVAQDVDPRLGFAPTDPLRLFRSIGVFIDGGKRSISDASLGSANLALMTLKLAEFDWRQEKGERDYTLMCVEEPDAHLHPHLQRRVFQKLFNERHDERRSILLTTHSPNIASVAPVSSIVVLRATKNAGTKAYSLATLNLTSAELEDLQRYLDANRADVLFSKGVIFVEGDAEAALVPVFAQSCGCNLDGEGIAICSVGGVNFRPYVRLALALALPFVVVTDWDPVNGTALGRSRALALIDVVRESRGEEQLSVEELERLGSDAALRSAAADFGIFLNTSTLELEVASTRSLREPLLRILDEEGFGRVRRDRIAAWKADPTTVDGGQLLSMVADIGKGRLAGRLATATGGLEPPAYIAGAVERVMANVQ
jgi:putative ATP-dependent endonuclease of OLD family